MTNAELLQLNPKHLAELRAFYPGLDFVDVELVASEKVCILNYICDPVTCEFRAAFIDTPHAVFHKDEDKIFYCVSYVRDGDIEDRAISKLIRR